MNLGEFMDVCHGQGVSFNDLWHVTSPDISVKKAIEYAASALLDDPASELVNGPIDPRPSDGKKIPTMFATILSASKQRTPAIEGILNFTTTRRGGHGTLNKCPEAETYFAKLVHSFMDGELRGGIIYTNDTGKPVILQKMGRFGVSSGMTLDDMTVNHIPVERFSIVRVDANIQPAATYDLSSLAREVSVDAITNVGFLRAASPVAPEPERSEYFDKAVGYLDAAGFSPFEGADVAVGVAMALAHLRENNNLGLPLR